MYLHLPTKFFLGVLPFSTKFRINILPFSTKIGISSDLTMTILRKG